MTIFADPLGCFKKKEVQHHTHNNAPLEQEQRQNMYAFYKRIEKQNQLNTNFLNFQPHVPEYLRDSMVDWLTSLHFSLHLTQPTLFLAVNIFDRFLSVELVLSKHDLKMVAIVALVIATKFEERRFPSALTLMENGSRFTLLLPSKPTLICVFQLQQLQPMTIFADLLGCFKKKKVQHHTDNNVALEQEQRQNMYAFYKHIEKQNQLNTNFLSFQPHVTEYLRDSMVDWLTSLHFSLRLTQPTLFLAVNILDRLLSVELVLSKHDLKMVAIVALVIASKFEERQFPSALTLMENGVGGNYSQQQIIAMEKIFFKNWGGSY
nr:cyclin-b1-2 [Quercus suber]